jgi:hypothetical protein
VTIAHVVIGTKRIYPRYTSGTVTKRRPDAQQRRRELCDAAIELLAQTPAGEVTIPMKMVYSGADPRLELLQTVPGTI